jgi:hypothetical protein
MPTVMTFDQAAQLGGFEDFESGVYKRFTELSPVAEFLPWVEIGGNSLTYTVEDGLPTASHRPINGTYTRSTPSWNKQTEELKITGDESSVDRYLLKTQGGTNKAMDLKTAMWDGLIQAVSNAMDQAFWEGDETVDINSPAGMRQRITGNQVVSVTTNGGPITLELLDQVIDLVPFGNRHIFSGRFIRRKVNTLLRAAGVSVQMSMAPNEVGRQIDMYGDAEWHVIERTGDATSVLGFDEQSGTSATTASLYVLAFGEQLIHGIYAGDSPGGMSVEEIGRTDGNETVIGVIGRLELYWGIVKKHDRAGARLRSITAA